MDIAGLMQRLQGGGGGPGMMPPGAGPMPAMNIQPPGVGGQINAPGMEMQGGPQAAMMQNPQVRDAIMNLMQQGGGGAQPPTGMPPMPGMGGGGGLMGAMGGQGGLMQMLQQRGWMPQT